MNTRSATMSVLVGKSFACVKIAGRANFASSVDFKTLVNELRQQSCNYFVLDLSECVLMDSTFLGVLAGLGLKMRGPDGDACLSGIELLNPNQRITELLENLGVLHLFSVTQGPLTLPDGAEARTATPANPSREEVTRACLEAHQTLMQINPNNVARFKDVAQFLAEDLKKQRNGAE
jgi:anti-sigma B factor antagonist